MNHVIARLEYHWSNADQHSRDQPSSTVRFPYKQNVTICRQSSPEPRKEIYNEHDPVRSFSTKVLSKNHARVEWYVHPDDRSRYLPYLVDLGSTHGTFLERQAATFDRTTKRWSFDDTNELTKKMRLSPRVPVRLRDGDRVTFGKRVDTAGEMYMPVSGLFRIVSQAEAVQDAITRIQSSLPLARSYGLEPTDFDGTSQPTSDDSGIEMLEAASAASKGATDGAGLASSSSPVLDHEPRDAPSAAMPETSVMDTTILVESDEGLASRGAEVVDGLDETESGSGNSSVRVSAEPRLIDERQRGRITFYDHAGFAYSAGELDRIFSSRLQGQHHDLVDMQGHEGEFAQDQGDFQVCDEEGDEEHDEEQERMQRREDAMITSPSQDGDSMLGQEEGGDAMPLKVDATSNIRGCRNPSSDCDEDNASEADYRDEVMDGLEEEEEEEEGEQEGEEGNFLPEGDALGAYGYDDVGSFSREKDIPRPSVDDNTDGDVLVEDRIYKTVAAFTQTEPQSNQEGQVAMLPPSTEQQTQTEYSMAVCGTPAKRILSLNTRLEEREKVSSSTESCSDQVAVGTSTFGAKTLAPTERPATPLGDIDEALARGTKRVAEVDNAEMFLSQMAQKRRRTPEGAVPIYMVRPNGPTWGHSLKMMAIGAVAGSLGLMVGLVSLARSSA